MGLQIVLSLHHFEGVVFDDLTALNDDLLNNTSFGELYSDDCVPHPAWNGVFIQNGPDDLKIVCRWDSDFLGYEDDTMVWGCYGDAVWQVIVDHMVEGKLVLHIDIEGNPNEYVIMTPDRYEVKSEAKLTF